MLGLVLAPTIVGAVSGVAPNTDPAEVEVGAGANTAGAEARQGVVVPYEYLVVEISKKDIDARTKTLNDVGTQGWELVAVHEGQWVFKRPRAK